MTRLAPEAPSPLIVPEWEYSPDPRVEAAIIALRQRRPMMKYADGVYRILRLLRKMGNPQDRLPPVFHVAGTNGKGSTIAFLQAIFESSGGSVHKFISPHLVRFEERIVLNGAHIDPDNFLALMDEVEKTSAEDEISFFEFFTALAILAFSRHPADAVLVETGVGGTFDATNIFDHPAAAIVTRISFDHQKTLGDTLASIAAHKAGIFKPAAPAVISPQKDQDVERILGQLAQEKGAALFAGWRVEKTAAGFLYQGRDLSMTLPAPALAGAHQLINAATAIAAMEAAGFTRLLSQEILTRAMTRAFWPGRMQKLERGHVADRLPQGVTLWLDGAHNDSGAEILIPEIDRWKKDQPLLLITAHKQGKDITAFYKDIAPKADAIAVLGEAVASNMVPASELCDQLRQMGGRNVTVHENLESALCALCFASSSPRRILATGSLYLVGHILKVNGG